MFLRRSLVVLASRRLLQTNALISKSTYSHVMKINQFPVLPIARRLCTENISTDARILSVLKGFDKINPTAVTLEASFVKDLGLDSLDLVEIVMALEDEFNIELPDEAIEDVKTVQDIVKIVEAKL